MLINTMDQRDLSNVRESCVDKKIVSTILMNPVEANITTSARVRYNLK